MENEINDKEKEELHNLNSMLIELVRDEEEKRRRSKNLIIFNVDETGIGNESERGTEEIDKVKYIIEHGVGINEYYIENMVRIGKLNKNRPRPLLLTFENSKQKWEILKNAKNLRNHERMRKIGIAPDLTKKQREVENKLKEELDDRRRKGEKGLYIKGGKLHRDQNFQEDILNIDMPVGRKVEQR